MGLKKSAEPTVEPVSLTDMKLHLRVDISDDDDLITSLIKAARGYAEDFTNRTFITSTYELTLDSFVNPIYIPRPKLQSITSIVYTDTDGSSQTLSASSYTVDTASLIGRVVPVWGESYPSTRDTINAVVITYKAGYGDAATNVPEGIIAAIKLLVGHWYENRETVALGTMSKVPMTVESLLWMFRVYEVV